MVSNDNLYDGRATAGMDDYRCLERWRPISIEVNEEKYDMCEVSSGLFVTVAQSY